MLTHKLTNDASHIAASDFTGTPVKTVTVLQNTVATLPCPYKTGDVSWKRHIRGEEVTLVTIQNGIEEKARPRYASLADNSLVIKNVTYFDSAMYSCNKSQIFLEITTDPNKVNPKAGNVPVKPENDAQDFETDSSEKGVAAPEDDDAKNQQTSDFWKIPVGIVAGAVLVLLATAISRFCLKKRKETNKNMANCVSEVIYKEIEAAEEQPRRQSDVESPYSWTSISDIQSTGKPPKNNLYSTVNKLNTKTRSNDECVYYLAQNPPQTGNG